MSGEDESKATLSDYQVSPEVAKAYDMIYNDRSYGGARRSQGSRVIRGLPVRERTEFLKMWETSPLMNNAADVVEVLTILGGNDESQSSYDPTWLKNTSEEDKGVFFEELVRILQNKMNVLNLANDIERTGWVCQVAEIVLGQREIDLEFAEKIVEGLSVGLNKQELSQSEVIVAELIKRKHGMLRVRRLELEAANRMENPLIYEPEHEHMGDRLWMECQRQSEKGGVANERTIGIRDRMLNFLETKLKDGGSGNGKVLWESLLEVWTLSKYPPGDYAKYIEDRFGMEVVKEVAGVFAHDAQLMLEGTELAENPLEGLGIWLGDLGCVYCQRNVSFLYHDRFFLYALAATDRLMREWYGDNPQHFMVLVNNIERDRKIIMAACQRVDVDSEPMLPPSLDNPFDRNYSFFPGDLFLPLAVTMNHGGVAVGVGFGENTGADSGVSEVGLFAHEQMHENKGKFGGVMWDEYEEFVARLYQTWLQIVADGSMNGLQPSYFDVAIKELDPYASGAKKILKLIIKSGRPVEQTIAKLACESNQNNSVLLKDMATSVSLNLKDYMKDGGDV